jgi:hypothetical protein
LPVLCVASAADDYTALTILASTYRASLGAFSSIVATRYTNAGADYHACKTLYIGFLG